MSGSQSFPPPGAAGPPPGPPPGGLPPAYPPGYGPPYPAGSPAPSPHPGVSGQPRGAAHKPGAIPLRPLGLGDIYDAAFKVIRFNPRATVGSAVLVTAVAMAIPVLLTSVLTFALDLSLDPEATDYSTGEALGLAGSFGSLLLGIFLQSIGLVLVTGMIAHVVAAAAVGQRLTLGEAWARTRGKRWRLLALMLLLTLITLLLVAAYAAAWVGVVALADGWSIVVFGLVTVPLFLASMCWFWVRVYYLPVPALMLEPIGVLAAIGRGYRLTRRAFWRTFGIALLTYVIAQIAGSMLSMPISLLSQGVLLGGASGETGVYVLVLGQAVASVITAAFVAPFTTSVATLQYVDLRMRQEAFDVVLMQRAGLTRS